MKTTPIVKKLPQLIDYAFALAISTVPGFAETDGQTKALYQSIAKQLLINEIKRKKQLATQTFQIFIKQYPIWKSKAA